MIGHRHVFAGAAAGQALTLLGAPLLLRVYSPSDYGLFATAFGLSLLASVLMTGRLELLIPAATSDANSLIKLLCKSTALMTISIGALLFFASAVTDAFPSTTAILIAITSASTALMAIATATAQRLQDYKFLTVRPPTVAVLTLVFQLSYAHLDTPNVDGLLIGYCLAVIAAMGMASWRDGEPSTRNKEERGDDRVNNRRQQLREAFRLAPAGLLNTAATYSPTFAVAFLFSASDAGYFALAQRLLLIPLTVIGQAAASVYIAQASMALRERQLLEGRRLFTTRSLQLLTVATLIGAVALIASQYAILSIFGAEWIGAEKFLVLLIPVAASQLVCSPLSQTLVLTGRTHWLLRFEIVRILALVTVLTTLGLTQASSSNLVLGYAIVATTSYIAIWSLSARSLREQADD